MAEFQLQTVRDYIRSMIEELETKLKVARAFLATLPEVTKAQVERSPSTDLISRGETLASGPAANGRATLEQVLGSYGEASRVVRAAIEGKATFSTLSVEKELIAAGTAVKRDLISQFLSKWCRNGEFRVLEQGAGRRASIYGPNESQTKPQASGITMEDM